MGGVRLSLQYCRARPSDDALLHIRLNIRSSDTEARAQWSIDILARDRAGH